MGNGLIRWRDGQGTHYWTQNGLIANSIDYLVEDDEGFLWIGSNAGLMRVLKKDLNDFAAGAISNVFCRGYDKRDGLPSAECTFGSQPAAGRTRDGTLWFPTHAGVVYVNPADIHSNTNPPPVVIEQVLVDGQEQNTNGPHAAPLASLTLARRQGTFGDSIHQPQSRRGRSRPLPLPALRHWTHRNEVGRSRRPALRAL
jgi:hypothetical protein